ncbi:unnamed protein product [Arctia plantaginis]|uniref:Major facilitator superfamily (MFS) profile domain-containing protein n=1 Tax=Arctia plantaginis TaxID=874455 RepID=A0A8S0Z2U2_ARCPL|nr:unnamed protein product [Arctia plantaginis]
MPLRQKTVEQALDLAGFSKYNLYLFLFYGLAILTMTFEFFGTFYIMPPMARELGVSDFQLEILTQVLTGGLFASSKIWAHISDTRGRKKALRIALTMSFLFGTFAAFSPHWIVLAVIKLGSAAGVSGTFVSSFPLLIECTPKAKRRAVVTLSTSTFLVALGTMAVLSFAILSLRFSSYIPGLAIYFTSWRLLCLLFALPSIFCIIGMRYVFESPKYYLTLDNEAKALELSTVILDEDNISTKDMKCLRSFWTRLRNIFKKPRMVYFTLVMKSQVACYVSAYCYIELMPIIASAFIASKAKGHTHLTVCEMIRDRQNTTMSEQNNEAFINGFAMTMVFTVGIALAMLNVIINTLTNYISRKRIIIAIQVLVTIAALCLNFSPYGVLTAILFMCVLSGVLNLGLLFSYVGDIFPSFIMSLAVAFTAVAGLGPASLVAMLVKRFIRSNCEVVFYIVTGVSLICVIIMSFLPSNETLYENRKLLNQRVPKEDEENRSSRYSYYS